MRGFDTLDAFEECPSTGLREHGQALGDIFGIESVGDVRQSVQPEGMLANAKKLSER